MRWLELTVEEWASCLGTHGGFDPVEDLTAKGAASSTVTYAARTGSMRLDNGQLAGGVAAVIDCVGSTDSIAQALRIAAPGATIHAVGMPGVTTVDLTPLWQREVALRGTYAYERADFDTAIELVRALDLARLVTATYPLRRYEDAITHAASAGARGAVKIAFDLRSERERDNV